MMLRKMIWNLALCFCLFGTSAVGGVISPNETTAWREDLRFIQQELPDVHPNPFHTLTREEFDASIDKLIEFVERGLGVGAKTAYVAVNTELDRTHVLDVVWQENVVVFPVTPWGRFVPALNAILNMARADIGQGMNFLSASVEVALTKPIVDTLVDHMDRHTLVVGAVLQGHDYTGERFIHEATGTQVPWNTLALWDTHALWPVGFSNLGEGVPSAPATAGVEEVATISLLQHLTGHRPAKLVQLPGDNSWDTSHFEGERLEKHLAKMASKESRPGMQLHWADLLPPEVIHL